MMQFCLDRGANPNSLLKNYSVLMFAVEAESREAVQLLLDRGANKYYCNYLGMMAKDLIASKEIIDMVS